MIREALVIAGDDHRIRCWRCTLQATTECETGDHHDSVLIREGEVCSCMSLERLEAVFSGADAGIWPWLRTQLTRAAILGARRAPGTITKPDKLGVLTRDDLLHLHANSATRVELLAASFLSFANQCIVFAM